MKNNIFLLLLLSMPLVSMQAPNSSPWEAKMAARSARFLERLAYFNTVQECEEDMSTESEADQEFAEGLMTAQELAQWRANRTQERMAHDQKIKDRAKNPVVEAALKKVTPQDHQNLYRQLNNTYRDVPTQEALKALGYEADAE